MFKLYCSSENDRVQGNKYLERLSDAFGKVSSSFTKFPDIIELNILSQEEWLAKPFGKSQPYGSPICPDYRIYIGQGIEQSLLKAINLLQKRLGLTIEPITEQDFGFLLVHEMGHVLLRYEVSKDFFHSSLFKQINTSKFSFLGEFHAQLVLMDYLRSLDEKTIWGNLANLCIHNKKDLEKEFGKLENFGVNYRKLINKNSGEGIYYFQLLFLGIARNMYDVNKSSNSPLKMFNDEMSRITTFEDVYNSQIFNKIIELGN